MTALTACAASVAIILAGAPGASSVGAPGLIGASGGPYALHSMLQLNSAYALKADMFAAAASAGASEIRVDVSLGALNNHWIANEMWRGLDEYERLSEQYGVRVLLDLNASNDPALETCEPGADPSNALCGVTDLGGYASEITALARQTAGTIDDFEIVNEPDGHWAFTGTPQQYAGMLATAYDALHAADPAARVILGGMMSPSDTAWLAQVFATPGFDAVHKFDIANVHLRDTAANMVSALAGWRSFFAAVGDGSLPLWVTETGYPSDPRYQFDPAYRGMDPASGEAAQAAFLQNALPALLAAGAARVFVTERDNLSGRYASEGLIGGAVGDTDPPPLAPEPKPGLSVFSELTAAAASGAVMPPAAPASPSGTPAVTVPPRPATARLIGLAARVAGAEASLAGGMSLRPAARRLGARCAAARRVARAPRRRGRAVCARWGPDRRPAIIGRHGGRR